MHKKRLSIKDVHVALKNNSVTSLQDITTFFSILLTFALLTKLNSRLLSRNGFSVRNQIVITESTFFMRRPVSITLI